MTSADGRATDEQGIDARKTDGQGTNSQRTDGTVTAAIDWDAAGLPYSSRFDDIYFNGQQGLEESRYVFLQHNQLAERFQSLGDQQGFTVGETGFGTGLNFLACWQLWRQLAPASARLTYLAVEQYPLNPAELRRSLKLWPELGALSEKLLAAYTLSYTGRESCFHAMDLEQVRLLLLIDDAHRGLQQLSAGEHGSGDPLDWQGVDAWFLDGFAPAKNPSLWHPRLIRTMAALSRDQATVATFTAAGEVRRNLASAGFTVNKTRGFGNKRHMLQGRFNAREINGTETYRKSPAQRPDLRQPGTTTHGAIAVIGAGLAGCYMARALVKRGYSVTLIDRGEQIAGEASGNAQGVVYARLSPHRQTLTEYNLHALLFAQQIYRAYWRDCSASDGGSCGVLQLSYDSRTERNHHLLATQLKCADFVRAVTAAEASDIAGSPLRYGGLFFPYCGWVAPVQLCEWLVADPAIQVLTHTQVSGLQPATVAPHATGWLLTGQRRDPATERIGDWSARFDQVVIANANGARQLQPTEWLPTKPIRGQISYVSAEGQPGLSTVVCGEGYITPGGDREGLGHCYSVGASFNLHDHSTALNDGDHAANIRGIERYFNRLKLPPAQGGRVGFRCVSPDYLPLAGPVPDAAAFPSSYRDLKREKREILERREYYLPGLYVTIAHGSRGLVYAPLAAEIIASRIAGELPPVSRTLVDALNPARFLIRRLLRSGR